MRLHNSLFTFLTFRPRLRSLHPHRQDSKCPSSVASSISIKAFFKCLCLPWLWLPTWLLDEYHETVFECLSLVIDLSLATALAVNLALRRESRWLLDLLILIISLSLCILEDSSIFFTAINETYLKKGSVLQETFASFNHEQCPPSFSWEMRKGRNTRKRTDRFPYLLFNKGTLEAKLKTHA